MSEKMIDFAAFWEDLDKREVPDILPYGMALVVGSVAVGVATAYVGSIRFRKNFERELIDNQVDHGVWLGTARTVGSTLLLPALAAAWVYVTTGDLRATLITGAVTLGAEYII